MLAGLSPHIYPSLDAFYIDVEFLFLPSRFELLFLTPYNYPSPDMPYHRLVSGLHAFPLSTPSMSANMFFF